MAQDGEYEYWTPAGAPTLMVIDDSPSIRTIIQSSFARVGIPVLGYPDGISAIAALTHDEVPVPNLVLLDLSMPKMDGYEVADILRTTYGPETMQIVMLTAHDDPINRLHIKWIKAKIIAKPFRVAEVVHSVCAMLHYAPVYSRGAAAPAPGGQA